MKFNTASSESKQTLIITNMDNNLRHIFCERSQTNQYIGHNYEQLKQVRFSLLL